MLTEFVFNMQEGSKTHSAKALPDWSVPPSQETVGELLVQAVKYGFSMRPRRFIPHRLCAQGKGVFAYLKGVCVYQRNSSQALWSEWLHLSQLYRSFSGDQTWQRPSWMSPFCFFSLSARVKDCVSIAITLFFACIVLKKKKRLSNWELIVDSTCLAFKNLLCRDTVAPFVENS